MNKIALGRVVPAHSLVELIDVLKDGIVLYRIAAGVVTNENLSKMLGNMADVRELGLYRLQPYIQEWSSLVEITINLRVQLYSRYFGRIKDIQQDSDLLILKQLEGETLSAMELALEEAHNPMVRTALEELIPLMEENFNLLFSEEVMAA